jgi:hypothetical protein
LSYGKTQPSNPPILKVLENYLNDSRTWCEMLLVLEPGFIGGIELAKKASNSKNSEIDLWNRIKGKHSQNQGVQTDDG